MNKTALVFILAKSPVEISTPFPSADHKKAEAMMSNGIYQGVKYKLF